MIMKSGKAIIFDIARNYICLVIEKASMSRMALKEKNWPLAAYSVASSWKRIS